MPRQVPGPRLGQDAPGRERSNGAVQLDERCRRVGADLVAQQFSVGLEGPHRFGPAPAGDQRSHEQGACPLAVRLTLDQVAEREHDVRDLASVEQDDGEILHRRRVLLMEPGHFHFRPGLVCELVHRVTPPQLRSSLEADPGEVIADLSCVRDETVESSNIHVRHEGVARWRRQEHPCPDDASEAADGRPERAR